MRCRKLPENDATPVKKAVLGELIDSDSRSFDELLGEFCSIANEEIEMVVLKSKRGFQRQISR